MSNRILLVDDEQTIRYALRETLIGEGYDVDIAKDAFQALEHYKQEEYSLVITDIKMHGMDGLQLIREIKNRDSEAKIIIITAYGSLETVKEAAKLGVVELISKPFKIQEIKDVIIRMLNENRVSKDIDQNRIGKRQANYSEAPLKTDNLLKPNGLSYYFEGPAYQPKSTVVFDAIAINHNRSKLIFGNINSQNDYHREWWENWQIGIMIKTLFRSKQGNTPESVMDGINKFLYNNIIPHIKVSMICVLIDKRKRVIKYANSGGHLVCSIITENGEIEILESNPAHLGILPEIDFTEETIRYNHENRLMLSRSNVMSRIVEEGAMIKQKIENALQNIKGSQRQKEKEIELSATFAEDLDVSFDDETVLLINLDKGGGEKSRE